MLGALASKLRLESVFVIAPVALRPLPHKHRQENASQWPCVVELFF